MVGPLRMYRVLGSVAFLSAGTLLRPILPKSQCWCVDGESKFVLRVATNMYYRIELPNTCQAENKKVEELKLVLAKVLRYELTPCPFKRGFTVKLPEPPRTPVRLRPWQPRPRLRPVTLAASSAAGSIGLDDSDIQEQERGEYSSGENAGSIFESVTAAEYQLSTSNLSSASGSDIDHHRDTLKNTISFAKTSEAVDYEEPDMFKTPIQPKPLRPGRNITAPQLSLRTPPRSDTATVQHPTVDTRNSLPSGSSSSDSFHSFHSPISPLPPSPPYSNPSSPFPNVEHDVLKLRRTRSFRHESSKVASIGELPVPWDITNVEGDRSSPTFSKAPTLISDGTSTSPSEDPWPEAPTPSLSTQIRHRRQAPPRRQTPSPLPLPANLYSPGCHLSGHHLTTAILQKTCSLLLGPPVQLVALMLNIAAKIARGAYRGASFGYGESGQKIPCSWDFSDAEDGEGNSEGEGDCNSDSDPGWEEDDFGVSLGANLTNSRNARLQKVGSAWEID